MNVAPSSPATGRAPEVLLVEEHALVRAGLRSLIDAIPGLAVTAEAADMDTAMALARTHQPDVMLVSAAVWARASTGVGQELRAALPNSCVLVIGDDHPPNAELAGGYCCLPRDAGIQEFCKTISTMLGGRCAECGRPGGCRTPEGVALLSPRERQVAIRVSEGLTSKQIASMLGLAIRTVNTYRESLARKLGASSAAALTRFVIETGMRDTSTGDDVS